MNSPKFLTEVDVTAPLTRVECLRNEPDMTSTNTTPGRERITFTGSSGNTIAADLHETPGGPTVVLAHGGGQTRHSWRGTAERLAGQGWTAIAIDQRGHGDSDWIEDADYSFNGFAADLTAVADQTLERYGSRPVGIGASLGGIAALLAEGESDRAVLSAVVLVDIAPRVKTTGLEKIQGFMRAHMEEGFATLEDAADAIAEYLPHRERPKDLGGLSKNLRLRDDGRYRWHWDPKFIRDRYKGETRAAAEERMEEAARRLKAPVLLVRGGKSELVDEKVAREFMEMVPHAQYADVGEARHMVAGDKNDAFTSAVATFMEGLRASSRAAE